MGKEKLEWSIKTNERMGGNWCKVRELKYKCPICNSNLFSVQHTMSRVMDGNIVVHCENDEHTFYKIARDTEITLYQNDNASETTFRYDKRYVYVDGCWSDYKE